MIKYILASASPRRKEILANAGISFDIIASGCKEIITAKDPENMVKELACLKCRDVCAKISMEAYKEYDNVIVIGADTMVFSGGVHMGKPKDNDDAFRMLKRLQNSKHDVITGVCMRSFSDDKETVFASTTGVYVRKLSDEAIREYINSGEGADKAGSYAIQGIFSKYISRIEGDYLNVVGFPLCSFCSIIEKMK